MKQLVLVVLALSLFGCRKKPDPVSPAPENPYGSLKLNFENVVDDKPLVLKTGVYTNAHGDTFSVNSYKYFITNIILTIDGKQYVQPESYFLIDQAGNRSAVIDSIPLLGQCTQISFWLGVDSARNVRGAQTGALDPAGLAQGMFWDWNQGYIQAKMEGTSPQSGSGAKGVDFHLGGYVGRNAALRGFTFGLNQQASIQKGKQPVVHVKANLAEWFRTPIIVDFSQKFLIMSIGTDSRIIADNYADMFTIDRVEN